MSPCVLPLVPAYLSIVSGVEFADIEQGNARARVIVASLGFILGFSIVFVALGATASAVGVAMQEYRDVIAKAAGVFAVFMGLVLMGVIKLDFLARERRAHFSAQEWGPWAAPLLGAGFAFGWTPCIGPVLGVILAYAATQDRVIEGAALLAFYAGGLGTPLLLTALAFSRLTGTWGWFKRHARLVNGIAGGLLVAMGVLLFTGQMQTITSWLLRMFPGLAQLG